jgi:hypothetical protein
MNCGIAAAETRGMLFVLSFSSVTQRQPGQTKLSVLIGAWSDLKVLVLAALRPSATSDSALSY